MPSVATPEMFGALAPSPRARARTHGLDLLRLAREVEPAEPALAVELRGMALHEQRVGVEAAPPRAWWRRAGAAVWDALCAYGEARARRDILALAERWETVQPERARELRAACARHA